MKAMLLTGVRRLEMQEIPDPVIEHDNDVLLKVHSVGVCGSDVHYFQHGKIGSQVVVFPFIVGHECAAVVEAVGKEVSLVKPGDRVALDAAVSCGVCDQCRKGRFHTCRKIKFHSCPGQAEGCMSEYIVIAESSCYRIPRGLSMAEAAFSEPLSCGLYAVKKAMPLSGEHLAIFGCGPIGLSVLMSALANGAEKVYVADPLDNRRSCAIELGAHRGIDPHAENVVAEISEIEPLGLDIVFECCGDQQAITQGVDLLKPGGKLVIVGIPENQKIFFNLDQLRVKELTIQNIRRQLECTEPALRMLEQGQARADKVITHRFPFEQSQKAFELVSEYADGVIKAVIDFQPPES